jgi:hypothetical protein
MSMHIDTIDWLREANLTPDAAIAKKRWSAAEKIAEKLDKKRVLKLLALFVSSTPPDDFCAKFTTELKKIDQEFPGGENIQELRLMAGLVIAVTLDEATHEADAFALGLKAANFPLGTLKTVHSKIVSEANNYLLKEASRVRDSNFSEVSNESLDALATKAQEFSSTLKAGDLAQGGVAAEAFSDAVSDAISEGDKAVISKVNQLAEECSFLWWAFNQYSDQLAQPTSELTGIQYALVAGFEAAQRTQILPPPPCIGPLLSKALAQCKQTKKQHSFSEYFTALNAEWQKREIKLSSVPDANILVPVSFGLSKSLELGTELFLSGLTKLLPNVASDYSVTPPQVAQQYYNELVFLRALEKVSQS